MGKLKPLKHIALRCELQGIRRFCLHHDLGTTSTQSTSLRDAVGTLLRRGVIKVATCEERDPFLGAGAGGVDGRRDMLGMAEPLLERG